jgi:hypothetical protein
MINLEKNQAWIREQNRREKQAIETRKQRDCVIRIPCQKGSTPQTGFRY